MNLARSEASPKISIISSSETDRRTSKQREGRGNTEEDQPILNQFSGWAHGIREKNLPHYKLLLLLLLGVILLAFSGSLTAHKAPAAKVERPAKTGLLGMFKRLNATSLLNFKRLDAFSFFPFKRLNATSFITFKKLNATSLFNVKKLNATSFFKGWKRLGANVKKTERRTKKASARTRSEKKDIFVERKSMVWA